jgi:hypothetical protein
MEAGKKRLNGDSVREANTDELRNQNNVLKIAVAYLTLEAMSWEKKVEWNRVKLKKYMQFTQQEKMVLIQLVENYEIGPTRTLKALGIPKIIFYNWYGRMC